MRAFIVTGSSRGLGLEICKQLMKPDHLIICIARNYNDSLDELAAQQGCTIHFEKFDLQNTEEIPAFIHGILNWIPDEGLESITLINNGAQVTPLGPVDGFSAEEAVRNVHINLLAPIVLTQSLLQQTEKWNIHRTIVNISSGSAKQPAAGMSIYCATKAALNMFTSCIQLEKHKALTIYTVDPGMIDTDMQAVARNEARLPIASFFREARENGTLKQARDVAKKIVKRVLTP
ncbi:SDR family NAD(P)-dependent oxidoreductase [Paenibacillus arenilitoris]|uniref:SDR family NAD(P)-dependent oxidoreductase n=1 Tax=Paenibacillus arenilitoris TaxID=2772299 RepID=A0A927CRF8_9BACL|nr:SDR family NAD(P)-dependent oxidoreductase [Paenibacillus arenilitoris]MBD2872394.1 SDR family NAD(P)-dependent oxidoreductase [Paenibacillus arenilitoris]